MRRVILAIVGTAAALVFLLSFKSHSTPAVASASSAARASATPGVSGTTSPVATSSPSASGSPSASASTAAGTAAKTVTGSAAQTVYGPVQVKITVADGKVTQAQAVEYPEQDPRDAQINAYAIPQLNQEAVAASSAQIDTVSGATYTSNGYISSLQSALDQAGL